MSETLKHPDTQRLQAYVEESLDRAERPVVASHLAHCAECRAEAEELHALFEALSGLAHFSPAPGFVDRVMAGVRVRQPALVWANERIDRLVERLTPQSTRGWAAAAVLFALPILVLTGLAVWLTSQPGVTPQGLWVMATSLAGDAVTSGWQWTWTQLSGSALATWVGAASDLLRGVGRGEIGLAVIMFATLTAASVWVLYQNLFRPDARRNDYASYVF